MRHLPSIHNSKKKIWLKKFFLARNKGFGHLGYHPSFFYFSTKFNIWELKIFLMMSWIWLLLWTSLFLHGWCVDRCFAVVDVLALSMFWQGQCFGALNGLALLMLWHCRCFGPVDILERLMFWRSRTNAGKRQSLRDLKYQLHLYINCTKTLTAPKNRSHHNTENAGLKGQLVKIKFPNKSWEIKLIEYLQHFLRWSNVTYFSLA